MSDKGTHLEPDLGGEGQSKLVTDARSTKVVWVTADVPAETVYAFARRMENLPLWASGLATGISCDNGEWSSDSPMGRVKISMAPRNDFGVLDHTVTLPDGTCVHNALRVTPAGQDRCVMSFIVLRLAGQTAEGFDKDAAHVLEDLQVLRSRLESKSSLH